jgi:hypothetical protein
MTPTTANIAGQLPLPTARNILREGIGVERPENGPVNQQKRRRPRQADAFQRATGGDLSPSHPLGPKGVQSTLKCRRQSPSRTTPNSDHPNGSPNGLTARATARVGERRTAWQLPELIRPLPVRRHQITKRPRLLPHYAAMVEFVYQSRFATGGQIQQRFGDYLLSQRTAQYQLANLVQLGYLKTAPVRSTSPNFPYVYYASRGGVQAVADAYRQLGLSPRLTAGEFTKPQGVALDSLLHELLLTQFELSVWKSLRSRGDLRCLLRERRYFRRGRQLAFADQGVTRHVIPDAGFLLQMNSQTSGRFKAATSLLLHFVELDNGTMSPSRIADKYRQYSLWAESNEADRYLTHLYHEHGENTAKAGFRLLLIAHANLAPGGDQRRLIDLLLPALELPSAMRDRIWLTTAEQLRLQEHSPAPLSAPIWLRARDAKRWMADYRGYLVGLPGGALKQSAEKRQYIAERIAKMPLHSLFPVAPATHGQ